MRISGTMSRNELGESIARFDKERKLYDKGQKYMRTTKKLYLTIIVQLHPAYIDNLV